MSTIMVQRRPLLGGQGCLVQNHLVDEGGHPSSTNIAASELNVVKKKLINHTASKK
jgi:hypothetical protein